MDPIYRVHWNNLTAPISVKLEAPEGLVLSKTILTGPKVKEESDIDPREILIDVDAGDIKGPIKMKVVYFACNDDGGWCKSLQQEYVLDLKLDTDGGFVARGGGGRAGVKRGKITSIDLEKNMITIQGRGGKPQSYKFNDKTMFNGPEKGSVSSYRAGQAVMLRTNKSNNGTESIQAMMKTGVRGKKSAETSKRKFRQLVHNWIFASKLIKRTPSVCNRTGFLSIRSYPRAKTTIRMVIIVRIIVAYRNIEQNSSILGKRKDCLWLCRQSYSYRLLFTRTNPNF